MKLLRYDAKIQNNLRKSKSFIIKLRENTVLFLFLFLQLRYFSTDKFGRKYYFYYLCAVIVMHSEIIQGNRSNQTAQGGWVVSRLYKGRSSAIQAP